MLLGLGIGSSPCCVDITVLSTLSIFVRHGDAAIEFFARTVEHAHHIVDVLVAQTVARNVLVDQHRYLVVQLADRLGRALAAVEFVPSFLIYVGHDSSDFRYTMTRR